MKETAQIFKALSDETRLRIVALLQTGGELCVCDLMEVLDLPQSTVSRHLTYLRHAGLANDRRQGKWMHYSLRDEKGLKSDLLAALKKQSNKNALSRSDQQRLTTFISLKKPNSCS